MSFFQPPPRPPQSEGYVSRRPPPWAGHGDNVLEAPVSLNVLLVRTERVAVNLSSFGVSQNGVSFRMSMRLREELRPRRGVPMHFHFMGGPFEEDGELSADFFRFGVQLSDGRTATNLSPGFRGEEPEGPLLTSGGGGGGGGSRWDQGWFLWPLPSPGVLTFVCEWPKFDVPETRAEVSADEVLAEAGRAIELWPDDRPQSGGGKGVWLRSL